MGPAVAPLLAAVLVLVLGARRAPRRAPASDHRSADRPGPPAWLTPTLGGVVVVLAATIVGPVAVGAIGAGGWFARRSISRAADARHRRAVARAVPDLVDLFLVAASAGHPVASALRVVADRAPAPVRPAVVGAVDRHDRGLPLAESLSHLAHQVGPPVEPLADALARSAATGVALVPLLDAVASAARDERRRSVEEAARRLPVTMLFPLAACTLPAAVLLAVVPVLVVSLASLSL